MGTDLRGCGGGGVRCGLRANGDMSRFSGRYACPRRDSLCSLKVARASKISGRKFSAAARRKRTPRSGSALNRALFSRRQRIASARRPRTGALSRVTRLRRSAGRPIPMHRAFLRCGKERKISVRKFSSARDLEGAERVNPRKAQRRPSPSPFARKRGVSPFLTPPVGHAARARCAALRAASTAPDRAPSRARSWPLPASRPAR